jgi:hypothetical protein
LAWAFAFRRRMRLLVQCSAVPPPVAEHHDAEETAHRETTCAVHYGNLEVAVRMGMGAAYTDVGDAHVDAEAAYSDPGTAHTDSRVAHRI